ncbi:MAG: hypothetical protein COB83_09015 [Gammaproteobacteria bacterium]|nr:MAG: hypothetical protein COB83_09015 [Gammaproteobacteria bacterium]
MYLDVLSDKLTIQTLSVCITFLYLAAFYLSAKNWRGSPSVFILASILFVNFFIANNSLYGLLFEERDIPTEVYYLNWLRDDAISIIITILGHLILRVKIQKITACALWILVINTVLYAAMHIDIVVLNNRTEPWWLWSIYSVVVNSVEFLIAALIIFYQLYTNNMESKQGSEYGI